MTRSEPRASTISSAASIAEALGSPFVSGPMYCAVGETHCSKSTLGDGSGISPSRRCAPPPNTRRSSDQTGDRAPQPLRDRPRQHGGPGPEARGRYGSAQCRAAARHVPYEHRGKGHPGGDWPRRRTHHRTSCLFERSRNAGRRSPAVAAKSPRRCARPAIRARS